MLNMRRREFITLLGGAAGRRAPNSFCARACLGTARYAHSWLYEPGVLTTSFMSKRLTPLNGLGTLSILPVPVALA
jgi:hypothetical protein